jgi:hypothetical protein
VLGSRAGRTHIISATANGIPSTPIRKNVVAHAIYQLGNLMSSCGWIFANSSPTLPILPWPSSVLKQETGCPRCCRHGRSSTVKRLPLSQHRWNGSTFAYLAGVFPMEEYRRRRQELEQRLAALDQQNRLLQAQIHQQREISGMCEALTAFCQRIQAGLAEATFDEMRQLVELLIDRVIVTMDEVEIRYVIPTSPRSEHIRFCHLHTDYFGLHIPWMEAHQRSCTVHVDQLPRLVRVSPQPNPVLTSWERVHADPPAGPRYSRQSRRRCQRPYILVMRCRSRGWLVPGRRWGRGWLIAVRGRSTRRLVALAVPQLEARNIGHQAGF